MSSETDDPASPTGRSRRPRGSLTPDAILDAAETVVSESGFDGLTVRAVAAAVGSAPMALYRHFDSKEALVNGLLDRVLGRFELGPPTSDWSDDLRAFAQAHRRVLDRHPWALAPLFTHATPGENAVRVGEAALAILDRANFSNEQAVSIFSGLVALNYGWVSFSAPRGIEPEGAGNVEEAYAAIPWAKYPLTAAVTEEMLAYGSERHYELVLDLTLDGIRRAAEGPPGPA